MGAHTMKNDDNDDISDSDKQINTTTIFYGIDSGVM